MPFSRPTLTELRTQVATDINAELPGVDALLRYSNLGILGDVQAAQANALYGYLDWILLQSVPFTATGEYLEGWSALKGVTRKPASAASGTVAFPATASAVMPSGTAIVRSDGTAYITTADAAPVDGTITAPIIAVDVGSAGNAAVGVTVSLISGVSGVSLAGAVAAGLTGGADVETDDRLRSRMLAAYANPPQGGSIPDYASWAVEVPGVTRAWVKPSALGAGTVGVLFMMDDVEAAHSGFPQGTNGCSSYETRDTAATGDQLLVANALFPLQSATALVYAIAPTQNIITLTIAGLDSPSDALKAAIASAVADALLVGAVPGGRTFLSTIEAAIAAVPGSDGFVITAIGASAGSIEETPAGNILSNSGALPVLGVITYP